MINHNTTNKRAARMRTLLEEINPLQRMLNSPGLDMNASNLHIETIESICADFQVRMNCWRNDTF